MQYLEDLRMRYGIVSEPAWLIKIQAHAFLVHLSEGESRDAKPQTNSWMYQIVPTTRLGLGFKVTV